MTEIQKYEFRDELQTVLEERGVVAPEGATVQSTELSVNLGVTKLYGVEVALPEGGVGRLVVREVRGLPDPYTSSLQEDHPDFQEFLDRRMSGIMADVQILSATRKGLYVVRMSRVKMQSHDGKDQRRMQIGTRFAAGKIVEAAGLLDFDLSGLDVYRELGMNEMDYSEPNRAQMVVAALRHRGERSDRKAIGR